MKAGVAGFTIIPQMHDAPRADADEDNPGNFRKGDEMKRQLNAASRGMTRLTGALMLVSVMALAACETSGTTTGEAAQTSERPATKGEIEQVAVGRTINGAMTYNTDGTYRFRGGNPGRYRIMNGRICVNFQSGGTRCDRIVTDGSRLTMINSKGERFPFG